MTATPISAPAVAAVARPVPAPAGPGVVARLLMLPVRAWRLLSVHLPPRCRFYPSCSQYALDALSTHGALRGSWLAVRRVGRCHPWHDGGLDPVPPARHRPNTNARSQTDLRATAAPSRTPGRAEET
jgi:putative membrane protein insertion efficiency factor